MYLFVAVFYLVVAEPESDVTGSLSLSLFHTCSDGCWQLFHQTGNVLFPNHEASFERCWLRIRQLHSWIPGFGVRSIVPARKKYLGLSYNGFREIGFFELLWFILLYKWLRTSGSAKTLSTVSLTSWSESICPKMTCSERFCLLDACIADATFA